MNKILNYIANGKGRGLKYVALFVFLICLIGGFVLYSLAMQRVTTDENIQRVLNQIPTLTIVDGKVVSPENAYIQIPFEDGFNDGIVIDTRVGSTPDLNFNNGMYITTDKIYLKTYNDIADEVQVLNISDIGTHTIDRDLLNKMVSIIMMMSAVSVSVLLFFILWVGFLFMAVTTGVFFWVLGAKLTKGTTARASTVSWMGMMTLNIILMMIGINVQSIPTIFAAGVVLAIILVFMAFKRIEKQNEPTVGGKPFFDTSALKSDMSDVSQPVQIRVKVATRKKNVKLTEKPRREPTKKNKK